MRVPRAASRLLRVLHEHTAEPVAVEHVCPLLQHLDPRPPVCGHARSLGQHCPSCAASLLTTHTASELAQQRSPQLRPGGQHTPTLPVCPDGLNGNVLSPVARDAEHTSPRLQHTRPHAMPLAQQTPLVQNVPWRQHVASASGVPTIPVTAAATLPLRLNAAQTKASGQQTPAATLPERLAATLPPLTQREPAGQHCPEQMRPLGQPPSAPGGARALASAHLLLPEHVDGGRQHASPHA